MWDLLTKEEFLSFIKKNYVYLCLIDNSLIAYLSIDKKDKNILLENLYVLPEYRNNGIAKKLIKKFTEDYKDEKNYNQLRLTCPPNLEKFYSKLGFKITCITMKIDIKH